MTREKSATESVRSIESRTLIKAPACSHGVQSAASDTQRPDNTGTGRWLAGMSSKCCGDKFFACDKVSSMTCKNKESRPPTCWWARPTGMYLHSPAMTKYICKHSSWGMKIHSSGAGCRLSRASWQNVRNCRKCTRCIALKKSCAVTLGPRTSVRTSTCKPLGNKSRIFSPALLVLLMACFHSTYRFTLTESPNEMLLTLRYNRTARSKPVRSSRRLSSCIMMFVRLLTKHDRNMSAKMMVTTA
mmetsp:Transcript_46208/g.104853  ORF Transcript_46208/g.104853 Transcript_46208/m.104853 type:complete len:244 (+) Transcript_46208:281-1012(+)